MFKPFINRLDFLVGPEGLKPSTFRLKAGSSNQLSYEPKNKKAPGDTYHPGALESIVKRLNRLHDPRWYHPALDYDSFYLQ